MTDFIAQAVLKRDIFSETQKGYLAGEPDKVVIRRVVTASPVWSRPLAWFLARREIAALRAVVGIPGTPQLLSTDKDGLERTWTEGAPLHLARPAKREFYLSAFKLLRALRRAGITHNDLAKPQNWLMSPDGLAAVIDFQLASIHRRRGRRYQVMAYEDFRHLLKQMRAFAPELMTPTAKRILARRSLPSRIWMATGKKVYNFVTRGIFNWSDGEGTGDRLDHEGKIVTDAIFRVPGVRDVALTLYPLPRKGVGIYAFVEADGDVESKLRASQEGLENGARADLVQQVPALPRTADGQIRLDLLNLVAMNQIPNLTALLENDSDMAAIVSPIIAGRLNFTDRRISRLETATDT